MYDTNGSTTFDNFASLVFLSLIFGLMIFMVSRILDGGDFSFGRRQSYPANQGLVDSRTRMNTYV